MTNKEKFLLVRPSLITWLSPTQGAVYKIHRGYLKEQVLKDYNNLVGIETLIIADMNGYDRIELNRMAYQFIYRSRDAVGVVIGLTEEAMS